MPRNPMKLEFPAAGVVRRAGLRIATGGRGPFPAPWAYNVRLEDSLTKRLRGGSFTGTAASARPSEILYRDRVLTFSGRAITATRMGDHTDTTLSSDVSDVIRPTLFQLSLAGEQGDDVVALIPHKDQFLLGFTATETWVQQGDPLTSPKRRVSDQVGIIGADAWCVAHDTVYFLSSRGLYSVAADGSDLKSLSEDVIPEHLVSVDDDACALDYDHASRSVSIHLATAPSWIYDVERGGFWPFDTNETDSHVLLGPIRLGGPDSYGRILNIQGTVAAGSGTVTWAVVTGTSEEAAAANGKLAIEAAVAGGDYSAYVAATGEWTAGRNHISYPRVRAVAVVLWLSASADWAYEAVSMTTILSGKWR